MAKLKKKIYFTRESLEESLSKYFSEEEIIGIMLEVEKEVPFMYHDDFCIIKSKQPYGKHIPYVYHVIGPESYDKLFED